MRNSKLLATIVTALLLGASPLIPAANAAGDEVVQSAGGVSYVSGGVGTTSIDRLSSLARDFNLKLVFALKSGDYVSDVRVSITSATGKTLVDTTSEGPWFLAKLPAGSYKIVAAFAGSAEQRTVSVGAEKLKTVDFRWAADERRDVSSAQ